MAEQSSPISISRANLGHLDMLAPLFDGYRQFYRQASDPAAALNFLKARIEDNSCVIFIATDEDGSGAGFVLLYQTWDSVDLETYWILHDLFIDPDCRTRGTGGLLMKTAEDFGRSVGASRMDLGTEVTNLTAQRLYESRGWQQDHEFFHYSLALD